MKIRVGQTVETIDGLYVIRHINRAITPALVLLSEKYKGRNGRRIYIRENRLEYSVNP